jgi:hypothetical protein
MNPTENDDAGNGSSGDMFVETDAGQTTSNTDASMDSDGGSDLLDGAAVEMDADLPDGERPQVQGTRYVRITTTESPSWVAWSEIEVYATPMDNLDDIANRAGNAAITASSTEDGSDPSFAVDGDPSTVWNSGDFPPAWIQLDLGGEFTIQSIRLRVTQNPPGPTEHRISIGTDEGEWTEIHSFVGETRGGQWLSYRRPTAVGRVQQWGRTVLSFESAAYEGNPFEIELSVEFTHAASGATLRLPGYYDGDNTWRVGFMPTTNGEWRWVTDSENPSLDGHRGLLTATASDRPGLLAGHPDSPEKWSYANGTPVIPIGVFTQVMLDDASDADFEAFADFMADHDLTLVNFRLSENDKAFSDVADPAMDLGLWRRLERRMGVLAERNIAVAVMLYTDDGGRPSYPPRSAAEQMLIRYTVARLTGFPGVIFNTGIDLREYRDGSWVNWFGDQIRALDPYGHPVSSRYGGGSGELIMTGQTYKSVGDRNSTMSGLLAAYERGDGLPAGNDDNWSEDLDGLNGHSRDDIRRAAWKSVVAGGVAFSVRHNTLYCPRGITECDRYFPITAVRQALNAAPWLAQVNPFVQNRLGSIYKEMHPAPQLIGNGGGKYALADAAHTRILCLLMGRGDTWDSGDGGGIVLRLGAIGGEFGAIWFDPRSGEEHGAGMVSGDGDRTLQPPTDQDWVLLLERR